MRAKVPQDINREDKIFLFISMRQLIILLIGFFLGYGLYSLVSKSYSMSIIESVLLWFPLGIAALFAFVEIKHMSLTHFILNGIEQIFFRPPKRYWQKGIGEPFVSSTYPFKMSTKKEKEVPQKEILAEKKIEEMAKILDGEQSSHSVTF